MSVSGPPPFDLRPTVTGDLARIELAGELDLHTGRLLEELASELIGSGATTLELACARVSHLDSVGLGALIEVHRMARDAHGRADITDPSPAVLRLLDLAGLAMLIADP